MMFSRHAARVQPAALAEDALEQPGDLPDVRARVQPLGEQVVEHLLVGLGVDGLLADEAEHLLAQLLVGDQRQRLLEHLDEPALALGQQQVQHVDGVGGHRLVRDPVQRQLGPVEADVPGFEDEVLVDRGRGGFAQDGGRGGADDWGGCCGDGSGGTGGTGHEGPS